MGDTLSIFQNVLSFGHSFWDTLITWQTAVEQGITFTVFVTSFAFTTIRLFYFYFKNRKFSNFHILLFETNGANCETGGIEELVSSPISNYILICFRIMSSKSFFGEEKKMQEITTETFKYMLILQLSLWDSYVQTHAIRVSPPKWLRHTYTNIRE